MKKKAETLTSPLFLPFRKTFSFFFEWRPFLLVVLFVAAANGSSAAEVAVIKSKNIQLYNLAVKGFSQSVQAEIVESDMDADLKNGIFILENVQSRKPDAVFSVGAEATYIANNNIKEIPIIFSMVSDPDRYKIVGKNITGVKLEIPIEEQIEIAKEILPGVRRIGAMYGDEKNKVFLEEVKAALGRLGIDLIMERLSSPKEIPSLMEEMMPKIDAFWLVFDSLVTSTPRVVQEVILFQALKNRVPVIGFNKWSVTAGALFCFYSESEDMGKQAGKIANRILKGDSPSSIPVESPENVRIFFNETVMERVKEQVKVAVPNNAYIWGR